MTNTEQIHYPDTGLLENHEGTIWPTSGPTLHVNTIIYFEWLFKNVHIYFSYAILC